MTEDRRILLDGVAVQVERHGDELRASDGRVVGVDEAVHLPPTEPTKIIAVHLNYPSRSDEFMTKLPPAPTYFHKPITALNSHKGAVVRPAGLQWLNYEGEIVIVIGKAGRRIPQADALSHIAALSLCHEGTIRDWVRHAKFNVTQGKNFDATGSIGPWLVPFKDEVQIADVRLTTRVNGETRQEDRTSRMIFSGTPANSRPVQPGDVVEVEVDGLGRLTNHVVEGPEPIRSDVGAQPTSSEEVVSTALGGDWEFRGIRTPSKDLYPSRIEESTE